MLTESFSLLLSKQLFIWITCKKGQLHPLNHRKDCCINQDMRVIQKTAVLWKCKWYTICRMPFFFSETSLNWVVLKWRVGYFFTNRLEAAMQRLTNLCSVLNDMEPVCVLNHVFVLREVSSFTYSIVHGNRGIYV